MTIANSINDRTNEPMRSASLRLNHAAPVAATPAMTAVITATIIGGAVTAVAGWAAAS